MTERRYISRAEAKALREQYAGAFLLMDTANGLPRYVGICVTHLFEVDDDDPRLGTVEREP